MRCTCAISKRVEKSVKVIQSAMHLVFFVGFTFRKVALFKTGGKTFEVT